MLLKKIFILGISLKASAICNLETAWDALIIGIHANILLSEDFYKETYFLNKRPINTSPVFLNLHTEQLYQNRTFNISAFYNETSKMKYTKDSDAVSSYIQIGPNEGFIPIFRKEISDFVKAKVGDIPKLVGLFTGAKVQQRRAGFMLQLLKSFDLCTVEVSTPLMYQERNYLFSEQEQKNIRDQLGEADKNEQERLIRAHFIADKLGIGDTRIKISQQLAEREKFCGRIGAQITLPTGFAFKNGLYGSQFRKDVMDRPVVNLCKITTEGVNGDPQTGKTIMWDLGYNTIDWLSAVLLDTPMGNNKHFAFGSFCEASFKVARFIKLDSVLSLEYIMPRSEKRFFIKSKNLSQFNDDLFPETLEFEEPDDIIVAKERINFLDKQSVETFFPSNYKSFIKPGFMLQLTVGPKISIRDWTFNFGYDFWLKTKENISPIYCKTSEQLINSQKPLCYQNKIFASAIFNKIKETKDLKVYLSGEHTPSSKGIGKDFTVKISTEINF